MIKNMSHYLERLLKITTDYYLSVYNELGTDLVKNAVEEKAHFFR